MAVRLPKIAALLVSGPAAAYASSFDDNSESCHASDSQKVDCGHSGTTQAQCEASGCCWLPVEGAGHINGVMDVPWCFHPIGPAPPPTPAPPAPAHCNVADSDKIDCGHSGSTQATCESSGCCWKPVMTELKGEMNSTAGGTPWCYYNSLHPNPCKDNTNWFSGDVGFTDASHDKMYEYFAKNLDVDGVGAVVASRDHNTPGGSYFYHWMRDGALSMKTWMDINDNQFTKVAVKMRSYAKWVAKVQKDEDPHAIDVRIEPKFMIPDGSVYAGGWCRPQTDGPGLRAIALSKWAHILIKMGKKQEAADTVFPLIEKDLDWVVHNWESNGCDLWEEVRSEDFFWGRMAFAYSLRLASLVAVDVGQPSYSRTYISVCDKIMDSLKGHWNGEYLYESKNRPVDGAVIHAIATFGNDDTMYPVTSKESAKTIEYQRAAFCKEYPINQQDDTEKIPGILIGRYPGDHYAGGNPWQLLSAVLAECFYLASKKFLDDPNARNDAWRELLRVGPGDNLAEAAFYAGEAVMFRLWHHVKNDGGRIDEQIDKHTGKQASAKGLTWSYANVLHALHARKGAMKSLQNATIIV